MTVGRRSDTGKDGAGACTGRRKTPPWKTLKRLVTGAAKRSPGGDDETLRTQLLREKGSYPGWPGASAKGVEDNNVHQSAGGLRVTG